MNEIHQDIQDELEYALQQHGEFLSIHEGMGVLQEEVYELWDAVRSDDLVDIYDEATQVAAMATKLMRYIRSIKPYI